MNRCSRAWGEAVKGEKERESKQKVTAANLTAKFTVIYQHFPLEHRALNRIQKAFKNSAMSTAGS